jgi:hypothetical protein
MPWVGVLRCNQPDCLSTEAGTGWDFNMLALTGAESDSTRRGAPEGTSSFVRYRRPQGVQARRRNAINRAAIVIRSALDPAFCRHAGNGVFARRVQFLNGQPFGWAHPLQGCSFDRVRNVACPRWHFRVDWPPGADAKRCHFVGETCITAHGKSKSDI